VPVTGGGCGRGAATGREAVSYTPQYQHPDCVGRVFATSDLYAVGKSIEEIINEVCVDDRA
jgi:hypothetical protein